MLGASYGKVFTQRRNHTIRQGCLAVVAAFTVVDNDAPIFKVDVFDAQAQTFHKAQPGTIHDLHHEFVGGGHVLNDGFGFVFREDSGDTFASFWADEAEIGLVEFEVQDIAIEEQYGTDDLILGGCRCFAIYDEVGNELFDLRSAHFLWMALVVKEDVLPHPFNVGFFGAGRILLEANMLAILVEKFFGFGWILHILAPFWWYLYNAVMQSIRYYTAKTLLCTPFWGVIQRAV